MGGYDREAETADVWRLRREGYSIRGIVRKTGVSRNTVRRRLRQSQPAMAVETPSLAAGDNTSASEAVEPSAPSGGPSTETNPTAACTGLEKADATGCMPPPSPWTSWDEVREYSQSLLQDRFLFVHRPAHLTQQEQRVIPF